MEEESEKLEEAQVQAEATAAEASAAAEVPAADEVETLRQQLEEEKSKSAEYYDQWLRAVAELRNYKKRVDQEREQLAREANVGLVTRLLPVIDDFDRAMAALPDEKLAHFSWIEGVALIYRHIQMILEQHGLRVVETVGQQFDPRIHEAILYEEVPAEQDQTVLVELQKGYKLYDRLLRPALVKVGKVAAEPAPAAEAQEPAQEESTPANSADQGDTDPSHSV